MDSWQGARQEGPGGAETALIDQLLAAPWTPRLLLRSAEPLDVRGHPFPANVKGAVFIKRTDAALQEWILAVGAGDSACTVSLQNAGAKGQGNWQHHVEAVANRRISDAPWGMTGLPQATPWGTALGIDGDGFLVEWDSRGADLLRREHWGPAFGGMAPVGLLCRSGQWGAAYFFSSGRVMKILSRGYFDGRALGSNRNLFSSGRCFFADLVDGHGQWQELHSGCEAAPLRGMETEILSASLDDVTGTVCVERRGGWLRIADDGMAIHAAALPDEGIPAQFRLRSRVQSAHGNHEQVLAAAFVGDALLYITCAADGTAYVWKR
jgi:hypothetical protein